MLVLDPDGLVLVRDGKRVKEVPWSDIRSVSLWPGSTAPRWSTGPRNGKGPLPKVTVIRRRATWGGGPWQEELGSFLILDKAAYEAAKAALAHTCEQHGVTFSEGYPLGW